MSPAWPRRSSTGAGDSLREAVTLSNLGEVCLEFGEVKEALDYLLRSYETLLNNDEGELVANIMVSVGKAYQRLGNGSLARDFAEKAIAIAMKDGNLLTQSQAWHLLGLISFADNSLEIAESQYGKALGFCELLKNERERAALLLDLGAIHALKGDMDQALDRFSVVLTIAEDCGAKRLVNTAYKGLSGVYETKGDFRKALDYHKRFSRFERESLSEDAGRKIKDITVRYEVEESSRESEKYRLRNIELKEKTDALESDKAGITHLANHDQLTGLPNRRLLLELLKKTFDIARRNGTKVGILYIDLDNFKPINDQYGHSAGDLTLVAISARLRVILRASDTVARVSGDEFVAVLTTVGDDEDVAIAARKIIEECGQPLLIEDRQCQVGFSIGIAMYPDDGDSIELIVNAADEAMYRVKRGAKNGFAFAHDSQIGVEQGLPVRPHR